MIPLSDPGSDKQSPRGMFAEMVESSPRPSAENQPAPWES